MTKKVDGFELLAQRRKFRKQFIIYFILFCILYIGMPLNSAVYMFFAGLIVFIHWAYQKSKEFIVAECPNCSTLLLPETSFFLPSISIFIDPKDCKSCGYSPNKAQ